MACHQVNSAGIPPVFPALAGSEIVMNDKGRQVEILMEEVQGAAMQSYAEQLTEVEIAAVITYTRKHGVMTLERRNCVPRNFRL